MNPNVLLIFPPMKIGVLGFSIVFNTIVSIFWLKIWTWNSMPMFSFTKWYVIVSRCLCLFTCVISSNLSCYFSRISAYFSRFLCIFLQQWFGLLGSRSKTFGFRLSPWQRKEVSLNTLWRHHPKPHFKPLQLATLAALKRPLLPYVWIKRILSKVYLEFNHFDFEIIEL